MADGTQPPRGFAWQRVFFMQRRTWAHGCVSEIGNVVASPLGPSHPPPSRPRRPRRWRCCSGSWGAARCGRARGTPRGSGPPSTPPTPASLTSSYQAPALRVWTHSPVSRHSIASILLVNYVQCTRWHRHTVPMSPSEGHRIPSPLPRARPARAPPSRRRMPRASRPGPPTAPLARGRPRGTILLPSPVTSPPPQMASKDASSLQSVAISNKPATVRSGSGTPLWLSPLHSQALVPLFPAASPPPPSFSPPPPPLDPRGVPGGSTLAGALADLAAAGATRLPYFLSRYEGRPLMDALAQRALEVSGPHPRQLPSAGMGRKN